MQTWTTETPVTEGTMKTSSGIELPLRRTDVRAKLSGPVADVEVVQTFENDTDGAIEAVYLFPLPHTASVHTLVFKIGDRVVRASVKEKEEAKRTYERARKEGRAATLLEQERPNLFTLSVANVAAGATIEVTLGYQEMLAYDGGEWRFAFPMIATERYHAGRPTKIAHGAVLTDEVTDAHRIRPLRPATGKRKADVTMKIELDPRAAVAMPRSPTHAIVVSPLSGGRFAIELAAESTLPNRDFVLAFEEDAPGIRPRTFFERTAGRAGTFLLTLTPPAKPAPDLVVSEGSVVKCANCGGGLTDVQKLVDVPGIGPAWKCAHCGVFVSADRTRASHLARALPRDVVFLVDRSRSMRGDTFRAARRAVRRVLDKLGPDDAVQLFAFDHDRVAADGSGTTWMPRSADVVKKLDGFLATIEARGGSELEEAFARAAKLPEREGRSRVVVLLTDAAVGNEGKLLRRVPEILGDKTRLFVLGVGPSVNRWLVQRLASVGRGASDVLLPHDDTDATIDRFASRVRQGGPVLTNLRLVWEDAMPADVYPCPLPDLFGGQPVQLLGRFVGEGPSRLVLLGTAASGLPFRQEIDVNLPLESSELPGLERLWARRRIDARLERLATHPEDAGDVRVEVSGLALRHGLVSPYTALVAEDSEVATTTPARKVEIAATLDDMEEPAFLGAVAELACHDEDECTAVTARSVERLRAPAGAPAMARPMAMPMRAMGAMVGAPVPPPPCMRVPSAPPPHPAPASYAGAAKSRGGGIGGFVRDLFGGRAEQSASSNGSTSALRPSADAYADDVLKRVSRGGVGELDLVFLVDETGSMGAYIEEVKARLLEMIAALRAATLCKSLRLGLVSYRDHPPEDETFVSRVVPLTADIVSIEKGVRRMEANGGGDTPEAVTDGLYDVARLDWRPRASRVVVWVGDAPPHGVMAGGDHFPKGCPCGHHWYTQAENCREMGIVIHAACAGHCATTKEVMQTVAKTTRGLAVSLAEAALLVPLIVAVAENELDKQLVEARVLELVNAHEGALAAADEQERVRWVTDVLRSQNVRPRRLDGSTGAPAAPALRFRALEAGDVEEAFDGLRRMGCIAI